jgi:excisionase family DNA binding protein
MNNENIVTGDGIEPDESRTPAEFADDELLTVEQVAREMNCSAITVRDWIAQGMIRVETTLDGSGERLKRSELQRIGNPEDKAAAAFRGV